MQCHNSTNNRAPWWTFTDPCKPEVRSGAREESASPAWLAAPAMYARDTTKVYMWMLDTGCGTTLYRKCHSHNTPRKGHNNTWVEPLVYYIATGVQIQIGGRYLTCSLASEWPCHTQQNHTIVLSYIPGRTHTSHHPLHPCTILLSALQIFPYPQLVLFWCQILQNRAKSHYTVYRELFAWV